MTEYNPTYCTPDDVFRCIRMIDPYDMNRDIEHASDMSHPTYEELCFRICAKEDEIDRYTGRTWRPHRVKNRIYDLNSYWQDANGVRGQYWTRGGNFIQLEKNVRDWDPEQGDKLEIRGLDNHWVDINDRDPDEGRKNEDEPESGTPVFWFDYEQGRMFIRNYFMQPLNNAIRISYRYGLTDDAPAAIGRCCALMTALTVVNEDIYTTKIGVGGDLGSARNDMKKAMQDEINNILMMYRTYSPVFSLYG